MTKFTSTNQPEGRGRPKGSVNRSTSILRDATPGILKELVSKAKDGDVVAASLVLKYSLSPKKAESSKLSLGSLGKDAVLSDKANLIIDHAMAGKCDPSIASQLVTAIGQTSKIIEHDDLINRIEALEADRGR